LLQFVLTIGIGDKSFYSLATIFQWRTRL